MYLVFHGGRCCGIKTIYGFGDGSTTPDVYLAALAEIPENDIDIAFEHSSTKDRFFHEAAPRETRLQRLDRYIDYVRRYRPDHIIEVTLAESPPDHWYVTINQTVWYPILKDRGFVEVNSNMNSNSGNIVRIFHLNIKKDTEA